MQSTSEPERKIILKIEDLEIVFHTNYHLNTSLRDKFITLVDNPLHIVTGTSDALHIIKKINLQIREGDRVALVGINGSGKTSLCRCINGMLSPQSGTIKVYGKTRGIFDTSVGILPELTGRENAYLLARMMYPELNKVEIKQIAEESLHFSELDNFADVPFKNYSKGMQMRLSLPLISSRPTDLLILDEVYDGADQFFRDKVSDRVLKLIHKSGSVLFVSHSHSNIKKACNRAILLHEGRIILDSTPEDVLKAYDALKPPTKCQSFVA